MNWAMQPNGTVPYWQTDDDTNILFPETEVSVGKDKKLRGGAPTCCPNFGIASTEGPYEGIQLPPHGLVRTCQMVGGKPMSGNRAFAQNGPTLGEDGEFSTSFIFMQPWIHRVGVSVKCTESGPEDPYRMEHRVSLGTELIHDVRMPYSIGFHPYFATAGKPFVLQGAGKEWWSQDLEVGKPFFTQCRPRGTFVVELVHGTVVIQINAGYTDYCIWTDRPDLYICVEPVRVNDKGYFWLNAGEVQTCECVMTYTPKV